jgi:hypothetical protein
MHAEAEALQQRAERRRGAEAVKVFQQAIAKYEAALQLATGQPALAVANAWFGCAESLQSLAEGLLQVCATAPDAELTRESEAQASEHAALLLVRAVEAYRKVPAEGAGPGIMRADAAVCAGNALSALAAVQQKQQPAAADESLRQAARCYEVALQQEDDTLVSSVWPWACLA